MMATAHETLAEAYRAEAEDLGTGRTRIPQKRASDASPTIELNTLVFGSLTLRSTFPPCTIYFEQFITLWFENISNMNFR